MKMSAGEASLLAKLETIEHNQKKIMEALLVNDNDCVIQNIWNQLDQELKEHKKLKAEAKKNGYTLAQYKKKLENDK